MDMPGFITVMCGDRDEQLVALADIAGVKYAKVHVSQKSPQMVPGCIIERHSSDYAMWCVESKEDVIERMIRAGAEVVRTNG
jgi:hypothetical protein